MMDRMDNKGKLLNSAFAVSGAFTFASHLAFTMAYNADYIPAVIAGKLVAGALSLVVGFVLYKKFDKNTEERKEVTV
jgi:ethanolamine transporter